MSLNKVMLPGNIDSRDAIYTEQLIGRPIPLVLAKPPKLLESIPSTPPTRVEDAEIMSAEDFPKLRGFA